MRDSLIGAMVDGRFQVESLIAEGASGRVYVVQHAVLRRKFALKMMRTIGPGADEQEARFRREARSASRIHHPHVAYVFDFGKIGDGRSYLVMEYVEGPTLAEVIASDGALSVSRGLGVLVQIADALATAHGLHVIHRDVKPSNVILTTHLGRKDYVKLLDFGLAKAMDGDSLPGVETREGMVFGTPIYMAPEQCTGGVIDHRADIYSFGVLAFEVLTGRAPFEGKSVRGLLFAHVETPPPRPSTMARKTAFPKELDELVLRCLAKDPSERFQGAADIVRAIQSIRKTYATSSTRPLMRTRGFDDDMTSTSDLVHGWDLDPLPISFPDLSLDDALLDGEPTDVARPLALDPRSNERPVSSARPTAERARAEADLFERLSELRLIDVDVESSLVKKLIAEASLLELEAELALLENELVQRDLTARNQECTLREALTLLERMQGVRLRTGDVDRASGAEGSASREGSDDMLLQVIERMRTLTGPLQADLRDLSAKADGKRAILKRERAEFARREEQVRGILRKIRQERGATLDPWVLALFDAAGI